MSRIDADSIGQRTASALERGLKDVVAVLARELNEVDGGRHAAGKAQPEFLGALHVEVADFFGAAMDVPGVAAVLTTFRSVSRCSIDIPGRRPMRSHD